jgi:predicted nucleic acid-binding protein
VTYFDTNVLVYFTIDQGDEKLKQAQSLLFDAIKNDTFFISPLVLSEYIFILSKLKILDQHDDKILLFSQHIKSAIDSDVIQIAYSLCKKIDFCKNINDVIHLKLAEQHCDKLVTFDKDFKKLQKETTMNIDIIV